MNLFARSMKWLTALFSPQTSLSPLKKENEDYCFTEIPLNDELITGIKLLTDPYKNVIYYYGGVKIIPESGVNRLAFQYTIWDSASFTKKELVESSYFTNSLGDVLASIIADETNSGEYKSPSCVEDEE